MKIMSTGDLHTGTECDDDLCSAVNEIVGICEKEVPSLILLLGDIYDKVSSPNDREIAKTFVRDFARICPVFIVKGNHDAKKDLLILGDLETDNPVKVVERPFMFHYDKISIHLLPWFTKAGWIAAKVGEDFNIETSSEAVSNLAMAYLRAQVAKAKEEGAERHLLFGHLTIAGAKAENHQPLLGEGVTLGYHDLVETGFEAGAFGHIHLAQKFGGKDGAPIFWYNGSPIALNYGESAVGKRFTIYETDERKVFPFSLKSIPRVTFKALWNGKLECPDLDVSETCGLFNGGRIRVKLLIEEGFNGDDGEKAVKAFISAYGVPLDLKIERAARPKAEVRSAEISKAKTAPEKLQAYWNATETTPEEPMRTDMLNLATEIEAECLTE